MVSKEVSRCRGVMVSAFAYGPESEHLEGFFHASPRDAFPVQQNVPILFHNHKFQQHSGGSPWRSLIAVTIALESIELLSQ